MFRTRVVARLARRSASFATLLAVASLWLSTTVTGFVGAQPMAPYTDLGPTLLAGTDPINSHPYGMAVHPWQPYLYVALSGTTDFYQPPSATNGTTVVELDMATRTVARTFSVGMFPTEIEVAADGSELYVVCSSSSTLAFVDLVTGVVTEVPMTDSTGALVAFISGVEVSADGTQLFVGSNGGDFDGSDENVIVVDRVTRSIVRRETLAGSTSRFAVLTDGRVVLPVGFPGNDFTALPEVRIYNSLTVPWTLLATLPMMVDTTTFPAPVDVAVNATETTAYVTVFEGSSEIFVVDLVTQLLATPITLPTIDFVQHGLEISGDGSYLYVTDFLQSQLRVVDLATSSVFATVPTGIEPNDIVEAGGRLWITDQGSQALSVYALFGSYVRGDLDNDGTISINDPIQLLGHLFVAPQLVCEDRGDADDDGSVNLVDAVFLLDYLFNGGPTPAYPFPQLGSDMTADALSCP